MNTLKIFLLFAALVLLPSSSFSQSGYPRLIHYNGDSVVAITLPQLNALNLMHVSYVYGLNLHLWDSVQLDNYQALEKNLSDQLAIKDEMLSGQARQLSFYKDLSITTQGQTADLNRNLQRSQSQKRFFACTAAVLLVSTVGLIVVNWYQ